MSHRVLVLAVAAGIAAGGGAALVQAGETPPPARSAATAPLPPPAVVHTGRLPDGRYDPGFVHLRIDRRTLRVAARVKDPRGGPDWVLRSFEAERVMLTRPARSLSGGRRMGRNRCVQLGRESAGRFGWVYGDGRFRAVPVEEPQLTSCGSRRRPERPVNAEEILDLRDPAAPKVTHEVLWGEWPGARRLTLTGTRGAGGTLPLGARDGFLLVTGAGSRLASGTLDVDGRRVPVRRTRGEPAMPGSLRVEAQTPDPAGGPPRGVLVGELAGGETCTVGDGQVVGGRVGGVDTRLGTFFAYVPGRGCSGMPARMPEEVKCNLSTGYGGDDGLADDPVMRRARVERRILPGRVSVSAICREDVVRVTLRTPRDIRTLAPSPFGHVVFAIYDGEFPSGGLVLTAHLRDGSTWKEEFPLGF